MSQMQIRESKATQRIMRGISARKGFTLIELLVVIAIIGILAGMLLPALGLAREKGRSARCISNIHQVLLMLNAYASDYDGYILGPLGNGPVSINSWGGTLYSAGYASEKNYDVFVCPSYTPKKFEPLNTTRWSRTYGLRIPFSNPASTAIPVVGRRPPWYTQVEHAQLNLYGLTNPTEYLLVGDTINTSAALSSPRPSQWYNFFAEEISMGTTLNLHARHTGVANVGFADGSVRNVTPHQLAAAANSWQRFKVNTMK